MYYFITFLARVSLKLIKLFIHIVQIIPETGNDFHKLLAYCQILYPLTMYILHECKIFQKILFKLNVKNLSKTAKRRYEEKLNDI